MPSLDIFSANDFVSGVMRKMVAADSLRLLPAGHEAEVLASVAPFFGQVEAKPKLSSADSWWWAALDLGSGDSECLQRERGIKREPGVDDDIDVKPNLKRQSLERRKSVRFADEADAELECVYPIPVKEETWPYGSLSGEDFPKAFPEFDHLYGDCITAHGKKASSLDLSQFVSADSASIVDDDLACFDDLKSCVGMAFLMMDGSITRGVCATSRGLWGKKFMRQEALVESKMLDGAKYEGLRPADYLETDVYVQITRSEVASVCRVVCVDVDLPDIERENDVLPTLTRSSPTHKCKPIKTFFYSWYFNQSSRTAHPYLASEKRTVSVFWPADRQWYEGVLDGVKSGLHRVVYDCDGSMEMVNLLQLREHGCLSFLG